ncbi:hypothetical protein TNCV_5010091 [Trichonephila clavipes]|nr:hypothetical protein TNCV_5010091 [Trichonephila clavipes]
MRLMTPPILKQADGSKPFTIRTDASSYALGAVLLQGSGPDEHVIRVMGVLHSGGDKVVLDVASENPALEYGHLVQKDESGKWKEEIKIKVGENYMRIILESLSKT